MKKSQTANTKKNRTMRINLFGNGTKPLSVTITDNQKIEKICEFLVEKTLSREMI